MSDWSKLGQAVPFRLQNLLFIYLFACLFLTWIHFILIFFVVAFIFKNQGNVDL